MNFENRLWIFMVLQLICLNFSKQMELFKSLATLLFVMEFIFKFKSLKLIMIFKCLTESAFIFIEIRYYLS